MNDLVDSTAFLVSTSSVNPWTVSASILKAIAVTLRLRGYAEAADWIDKQVMEHQQNGSMTTAYPTENKQCI